MRQNSGFTVTFRFSLVATMLLGLAACVPMTPAPPDDGMPPTDEMPDDGMNVGDDMDGDMPMDGDDTDDVNDGAPDGSILIDFARQTIDDTILRGQSVRMGDVDVDGDVDIVVASSLLDAVILYVNGGDGQSFTRVNVSGDGTLVAADMVIIDVDLDGDGDIVAIEQFSRASGTNSAGRVVLFRNPGTPTGPWSFEALTESNIAGPSVITAAPLSGSGRSDLVVGTNGGVGTVASLLYLVNLGGTFDAPISIDADPGTITAMLAHDVDADGLTDLIVVSRSTGEVRWYKQFAPIGQATLPSFAPFLIAPVDGPNDIALGQFDDDAALELVVATADASSGLILLFDPPANPQAPWTRNTIDPAFGVGQNSRVVAGDFNQDGFTEIAALSNELGVLQLYTNSRDGFVRSTLAEIVGLFDIEVANLTDDRRPDLMVTTLDGGLFDTVTVFRNTP